MLNSRSKNPSPAYKALCEHIEELNRPIQNARDLAPEDKKNLEDRIKGITYIIKNSIVGSSETGRQAYEHSKKNYNVDKSRTFFYYNCDSERTKSRINDYINSLNLDDKEFNSNDIEMTTFYSSPQKS